MENTLEQRVEKAIERVAKNKDMDKDDKPMAIVAKVISTLMKGGTSVYDGKKLLDLATEVLDRIEI